MIFEDKYPGTTGSRAIKCENLYFSLQMESPFALPWHLTEFSFHCCNVYNINIFQIISTVECVRFSKNQMFSLSFVYDWEPDFPRFLSSSSSLAVMATNSSSGTLLKLMPSWSSLSSTVQNGRAVGYLQYRL